MGECAWCNEPGDDVRGFCSLDCLEHEAQCWRDRADDLEGERER